MTTVLDHPDAFGCHLHGLVPQIIQILSSDNRNCSAAAKGDILVVLHYLLLGRKVGSFEVYALRGRLMRSWVNQWLNVKEHG